LATDGNSASTLLRPLTAIQRLFTSLTFKLVMLVGIFVALPVILYTQFEKIDGETRALVTGNIQHRSWLIAQALAPLLEQTQGMPGAALNGVLDQFVEDGTTLKLTFRPKAAEQTDNFYLVAAAPTMPQEALAPELDGLAAHGVLKSLTDSCSWNEPVEFRYQQPNGTEELLTSVIPVNSAAGCWVLISTHNSAAFLQSSIGRPLWQTDGVRLAAMIYMASAGLALLMVLSAQSSLRHFRNVAHEIRRGGTGRPSFASRKIMPELTSVAVDFDHLVKDLHQAAADIRRTAEENAHAVKTPLAIIRSALVPLKRSAVNLDERAQRATQVIDSALSRLTALTAAAQRLGNDTADFIEAPKVRINLTSVVFDVLHNARDLAAEKGVKIVHRLDADVHVLAPDGVLDEIVENIVDNALSFSSAGGKIAVTLSKINHHVGLYVEDEGPGIDPGKIGFIFERHFSLRPMGQAQDAASDDLPSHSGLGLWIVRRHIEALGGAVTAANRATGGLCVHVTLRINNT
jgi:two-component system sensor histidine kinase ChvG